MCGIIGYTSSNKGKKFVLQGLKNLEYRGYDSCGLSMFVNDKIKTFKSIKRIENLEQLIDSDSNTIIAHTRWATHGKANLINCHPVISKSGRFVIVHNGIIENYQNLKVEYLKNYHFKTNTDTEVIVNLIDYYFDRTRDHSKTMIEVLQKITTLLEGTFACLIIDSFEPNKIWFIKKKSPLLLGRGTGYYIVSDLIAFPADTKEFIRLEDNSTGYITKSGYLLYRLNEQVNGGFKTLSSDDHKIELGDYHHYMEKEIYEQPNIIKYYLTKYFDGDLPSFDDNLITALKSSEKIYLVASGTSYHSALLGSYFFNNITKKESYAFLASEFNINHHIFPNNSHFIVISQSGETADVIKAIEQIKTHHYSITAITNVVTSTIATTADFVIDIYAGREIAVASTKAYTASTTILYLLANALSQQQIRNKLINGIEAMSNSFTHLNQLRKLAIEIAPKEHLFFLGKQIDYLLAMEASLKLKEISYIHSESFAAGELKHGTIALITDGTPVIAFITDPAEAKSLMSSIEEVKTRGARVITILTSNIAHEPSEDIIVIDQVDSLISYLPLSIIFQLFAYYVALERETDIDKPRNLAKSVTVN